MACAASGKLSFSGSFTRGLNSGLRTEEYEKIQPSESFKQHGPCITLQYPPLSEMMQNNLCVSILLPLLSLDLIPHCPLPQTTETVCKILINTISEISGEWSNN